MAQNINDLLRILSGNKQQNQNIELTIPQQRASYKEIRPTGPVTEIFDPALEMSKKGSDPAYNTVEGIAMAMKLFDEADRLIPAQQNPVDASITGYKRSIGSTDIGRFAGVADEDARAYKNFLETFGTLLARAFGERGVVTNQDVRRVMSAFPKFGDSSSNRQTQRQFINSFLTDKINRYNKLVSIIGNKSGGTLPLGGANAQEKPIPLIP